MKYENDYGDLRLYYHDFPIIASLIYFCLLSLSALFPSPSFLSPPAAPSNLSPMARAEVEQKGKLCGNKHSRHPTYTCTQSGELGVTFWCAF